MDCEYEVKYIARLKSVWFFCEAGPVEQDCVRYTAVGLTVLEAIYKALLGGNRRVDWLAYKNRTLITGHSSHSGLRYMRPDEREP